MGAPFGAEPAVREQAHAADGDGALVGPGGEGLTVIVNAGAGPALASNPAAELREALPGAAVIEVGEADDLADTLERAAASSRVLGAAGGDGTLNAAAAVALRAGTPLLVVPAGTLNHLARDLGLDGTAEAVEAARRGAPVTVDVGVVAGRPFLNTASLGGYPEMVDMRQRMQSRIGKWPAAVVAFVRTLRHGEPCHVEIDGRPRRIWMLFAGNCRYSPPGALPAGRERLDDGLLDVRIVEASRWARLRVVAAALTGRLARCPAYEERTAARVEIRSLDGPVRLACDGETFDGPAAFSIEKRRGALPILLPD